MAHAREEIRFREIGFLRRELGAVQREVRLLQRLVENFSLRNVAGRRKHTLQGAVAIVEGRGVVGHHRLLAVPGAGGELIVGERGFTQHAFNAGLGTRGIGEVVLERRTDQLVARAAGEGLHLFVDVGNDAGGIGRDEGVDVRFDQRPGIELLVAQALIEPFLLALESIAQGVVGADEQVTDDARRCVSRKAVTDTTAGRRLPSLRI